MSTISRTKEETLVVEVAITMTEQAQLFSFEQAMDVAQEIVRIIDPYSKAFQICGGLRRRKQEVHDIDIVCQDMDRFSMNVALGQVCTSTHPTAEKISFVCRGIPCEIFFVANEQQFEVMKLERTGDFQFTRTLAQNAITKGMVFRFSRDKGYYKIPMYGLYRITGTWWDEDADRANRKKYLIGDMVNPVAYKEDEIIETIFNRQIPPESRSWFEGGQGDENRSQQSE